MKFFSQEPKKKKQKEFPDTCQPSCCFFVFFVYFVFVFVFFHGSSGVRHRVPGGVSSVKKEGGIHRLHNRDDEDDDNNTWNGNSTQQM